MNSFTILLEEYLNTRVCPKFTDWPPGSTTANDTALCHKVQLYLYFVSQAGNFSLHHSVQNGSEAHPASYPMGTTGSFPGSKAAGAGS
jgi:hypothetical protein